MVTPLVFDLNLNFESDGYEIDKIYGTDSQDKSYGNIMKVNTLFPSNTNEDSEAKGGVILLKLKKKENSTNNKIYHFHYFFHIKSNFLIHSHILLSKLLF